MNPPPPFKAHLTPATPLRGVFPDGFAPVMTATPQQMLIGTCTVPQPVFMIDLNACTHEQRSCLAALLTEKSDVPFFDALRMVETMEPFPVRVENFNGRVFPVPFNPATAAAS